MKLTELRESLHNQNIRQIKLMPTPAKLKRENSMTAAMCDQVLEGRIAVRNIITGSDDRFLIIGGPCSMHNPAEYLTFTELFVALAKEVSDVILLVQRSNPLKPRSESGGWQGMAADCSMRGEKDLAEGCRKTRETMAEAVRRGALLATEIMDPDHYQYIDDLPAFAWIGADNCTSTLLRQVASGLSCPVGCKHPKQPGSTISAVRALGWVSVPNTFLSQDDDGRLSQFMTNGNVGCIIHRGFELGGGKNESNYDERSIQASSEFLAKAGLNQHKLVDLSHSNSNKKHEFQVVALEAVLKLVDAGIGHIAGVMWEAYLRGGKQPIPADIRDLLPGISVTDECDGWDRFREHVLKTAEHLRAKRG